MDDQLEMARGFYGFGRWDAPYWFIGPEPGKGPNKVTNDFLAKAWKQLASCDLCDCKAYHLGHGETSWHGDEHRKPLLQPTWKSLLVLLMAFLEEPNDSESRRKYQRDLWGRKSGQTCVIELSGLAATGYVESIDRDSFRAERVSHIGKKLSGYKPAVVVFYGLREKKQWEQIAELTLTTDVPVERNGTLFVMTPHPNDRGRTNADWDAVGRALRKMRGN